MPAADVTRRSMIHGFAISGATAVVGRMGHAAAATEAKVAVNTFTGQAYGRVFKLFVQTYPDIKLEHTSLEPVDFVPRLIAERKANVFSWDVATMPMTTALQVLKPAGVWDPVGFSTCNAVVIG